MADHLEKRSSPCCSAEFGRSKSNDTSVVEIASRLLRSLEVIGTDTDRSVEGKLPSVEGKLTEGNLPSVEVKLTLSRG